MRATMCLHSNHPIYSLRGVSERRMNKSSSQVYATRIPEADEVGVHGAKHIAASSPQ